MALLDHVLRMCDFSRASVLLCRARKTLDLRVSGDPFPHEGLVGFLEIIVGCIFCSSQRAESDQPALLCVHFEAQ